MLRPDILTSEGFYFDFLEPGASTISIIDIAHGLSRVCRFAGQCRGFYSVAEHSVWVSRIVPAEDAFAGLMHDAAEAFIGDVSAPLKRLLPDYKTVENRVEAAIAERFHLTLPLPYSVKHADLVMLATEQVQIMPPHDDEWGLIAGIEPLDIVIAGHAPAPAKSEFLARFDELYHDHLDRRRSGGVS